MKNLKQIIAVMLSAVAVISTAAVSASALDSTKYDLNGDGKFDVLDVTALQISISGDGEFTDKQKEIADYNKDGKIDVQDVTTAQIIISGDLSVSEPTTQPTTSQPTTAQPSTQPTTTPTDTATYNREFSDMVIELINEARAKEGLSALKTDDTLTKMSDVRAKETVTLFSHQRPDGSSWATVMTDFNYSYSSAAENIAAGQTTPEAVVDAWLNSPPHRENIMSEKYNRIAVSCYVDKNSEYGYYWNLLFAKV